MKFGGDFDYILKIIGDYPFRDRNTYTRALEKIEEIRNKSKEKLNCWIEVGLIKQEILERPIKQYKTDDPVKAYEDIRYLPYNVSWYLDANNIEKGKLTEYFAKLFIFCDVAKKYIEERIALIEQIEKNKEEAKRLGIVLE